MSLGFKITIAFVIVGLFTMMMFFAFKSSSLSGELAECKKNKGI